MQRVNSTPRFGVVCKKIWACICPRCGQTHKLKLFWTGNGVPKKFCNAGCITIAGQIDTTVYAKQIITSAKCGGND